ncbi:hypothetical protein GCM10027176_29900 [Actinoallomurus bryophytorum]|uniref:Uncharacterized protein n=1 Tax=Actinoallomurus bryophytorum TaxID=1490222 RepID=A0A543CGD1_9ACTN|nr:hypothetical protein [Actinoallomurus bryophytorum]TQL96149.1 hypothetical protein FB559_1671 [Actinoallomurus bryophytorum]
MRITKLLATGGAAVLAGTALVASTGAATAGTTATAVAAGESRQLASATVGTDLTVTVRAQRTGESSANVYLAFSSHGSQWSERVPGDWFWYPLTGQGAVCEFGVTSLPGTKPVVGLSLLITPSIGCSDTLHYTVG